MVESLEERWLLAVTLVSQNASETASANGAIGGIGSHPVAVSTDGRYVAFVSDAPDVVSGATTVGKQVYLRDRTIGTTVLVSHNGAGNGGNRGAYEPRFSHDGSILLFESESTDLPGDSDFTSQDVFAYVIATGAIEHVSPSSIIQVADAKASANGRYIVYTTGKNIFRHDRTTDTTTLLTEPTTGGQSDFSTTDPHISADGRYVSFYSFAPNLPGGPTDINKPNIYIHDTTTGTNIIATPGADGYGIGGHEMSADGRYIAFHVQVNTGTYVAGNAYIYDRTTNTATLVSKKLGGAPLNNLTSTTPILSRDGSTIAFINNAADIVASDPNGTETDIFIYNVATGNITRLDAPTQSGNPHLSDNGQVLAFTSFATPEQGSAATDNNATGDVFIHDRGTGATRLLSVKSDLSASSASGAGSELISGDGSAVVFQSSGSDLVSGFVDGNTFNGDLFSADSIDGIPAEGGTTPGDTTAPTAAIQLVGDAIPGEIASNVQIVFTDETGIDPTTINSSLPLSITGPGDTPLTGNYLVHSDVTATSVTILYQLPAIGGSFDPADNGTYSVSVPAGIIRDTSGNANAAASLGTFELTVAGTGGLSGLTAEISVGPTFLARLLAARSAPVTVRVSNPTDFSFSGDVDADVVASTDGTIDDSDEHLGTITGRGIRVRANRTSSFTVNVTLDADVPEGDYFIGARLLLKDKDTGAVLRTIDVITPVPITLPSTRSGVIDADGTIIRVSARDATGGIVFDPSSGLYDLVITTTRADRSITISTSRGDRIAVFSDILITGSVRSIRASRVDIRGSISVTGSLRSLTLRDIADQHTITVGAADTPVTMKFGNVSELSINSAARITSLDVKNWIDQDGTPDVITAPSIGTLRSRGDFNADLNLSGLGVEPGKRTLTSARATGAIGADTWNITGNVGSIRAATIVSGWAATVVGTVRSLRTSGDATGTLTCFELENPKRIDGIDQLTVNIVTA